MGSGLEAFAGASMNYNSGAVWNAAATAGSEIRAFTNFDVRAGMGEGVGACGTRHECGQSLDLELWRARAGLVTADLGRHHVGKRSLQSENFPAVPKFGPPWQSNASGSIIRAGDLHPPFFVRASYIPGGRTAHRRGRWLSLSGLLTM